MTVEIAMLFWAAVLGLVQVGLQSLTFKKQVGNAYTVGARDEPLPPTGLAGRMERALRNFLETFPIFAAVILAVYATERSNQWSEIGAQIYFWARLAYVPAYAAGLPWVRTLIWQIATIGIVLCMVPLFDRALLTVLME
ncbi:MAG: MAPEG family protein [Parvibaculum sp.]|uniref:MAPEG family protein n=1 Tax=Parvibaculum sp. TaxID=2024848 RepID=UPI002719BFE2|nr:MAPEG family protein [Parvibaculum sp.]MDO8839424.1 MAPEG family protein [Parvibaculum sp.]